MKEITVKIKKFTIDADDSDKELLYEAIQAKVNEMLEEQSLVYTYTVNDSEEEEDEE